MSTIDSKQQPIQPNLAADNADEIDLGALIGTLIDRKLLIVSITALFALVGIAVALLSTPIYNATSMIQVEENSPSIPGLDDMSSMFEGTSEAITEIELLKSRTILGQASKNLKLDTKVAPKLFPVIGPFTH